MVEETTMISYEESFVSRMSSNLPLHCARNRAANNAMKWDVLIG